MKKKLESELISIAHKVLKLKGREDVVQLHQEAQKLYEKLSILRFYEENIAISKAEISENDFEEKLENVKVAVETPKGETVQEIVLDEKEEIITETDEVLILENDIIKEEIVVEVENKEEVLEEKSDPLFNPSFELTSEEVENKPTKENKQVSLEDFLHEDYKDLEFIKVDEVSAIVEKVTEMTFEKVEEKTTVEIIQETKIEVEKTDVFEKKTEHKLSSLNDTLLKGIHIGLNDRIAFVKHLFEGSDEDYNRVLSQISTFSEYDEAQNFIENMVKPDHNNWENKEEYATRFLSLIEKKFN